MQRFVDFLFLIIAAILCAASAAEIPIPANYQISSPSTGLQNEEQVCVSPIDSNLLIADWRDFRLGYRQVGIGRSTDGGNTWTDALIPPSLQVMTHQSDPALAVDGQGNFYVCVLDYRSIGGLPMSDSSHISVLKSTDGGLSWTGPVTIVDTIGPYFEDKEFIACDRTGGPHDGNLYVAWARVYSGPTRIMFSRSIDGGASFDDTVVIGPPVEYKDSDGAGVYDAGQFAQPLVGSDGSVYVFYVGYFLDEDNYWYDALTMVKSTDGGVSWTDPQFIQRVEGHWTYVDGGIDVYSSPSSATDIGGGPHDGNLYIAYATDEGYPIEENFNICFIRSTDDGQSWSEPITINDDNGQGPNPPYDQFHPWLYCNDDGMLTVIFYDQRTDSLNHYMFDVFAAYSFDGGETFTANHRISSVSIDPDYLEPPANLPIGEMNTGGLNLRDVPRAGKIAEYIGVTAAGYHVNAVWTDTRNGDQDVYGANWIVPLLPPSIRFQTLVDSIGILNADDTLFWSPSWLPGEATYRLEIDDQPDFLSPELTALAESPHFLCSDFPFGDGLYYCRLKAFLGGDSSTYSDIRLFEYDTEVPSMAADLNPGPGDTLIQYIDYARLEWSVSSGNNRDTPEFFEVEMSDDSLFMGGDLYFHWMDLQSEHLFFSSSIAADTIYYWRVNHYDLAGNESGYCSHTHFLYRQFHCGDANGDRDINVGDAVYLINYVFKSGPAPNPIYYGDANWDGDVDVGDAVYIINYVFRGGDPPNCEIYK